jgi:hypothetical protein
MYNIVQRKRITASESAPGRPRPTLWKRKTTETLLADTYLPPEANAHIRSPLFNASSTQDVQVAGVGTTRTGYIIRFKDPEAAETARNNTEWLQELGNETKLVKPRHGVVVHHLPI